MSSQFSEQICSTFEMTSCSLQKSYLRHFNLAISTALQKNFPKSQTHASVKQNRHLTGGPFSKQFKGDYSAREISYMNVSCRTKLDAIAVCHRSVTD